MPKSTTAEFTAAMLRLRKPAPSIRKMLRFHLKAPNQVSIARELAKQAGFKSWHAVNLHYGTLGKRLARELGTGPSRLSLLVRFVPPGRLTNKEWLVMMRPEFAAALRKSTWI